MRFLAILKKRNIILKSLQEEIIDLNIEINIRNREINLKEDIGKMLYKILEKTRKKIDLANLIVKDNRRYSIEKDKEQIKYRVYEYYRNWT